tara:strand:- start:35 stop:160 length:126 start_codon:yes stop_codon:yes gene_type:complete
MLTFNEESHKDKERTVIIKSKQQIESTTDGFKRILSAIMSI